MESPVKGRVEDRNVKLNIEKIKSQYYLDSKNDGNELIYHYTDLNGFFGIIKTKQLWASNISYLNDYSELDLGVQITRKTLKTVISRSSNKMKKEFATFFKEAFFGNVIKELSYVVSFCGVGDLLSQWRAYGSETQGIAIGFKKNKMEELLLESNGRLLNIIYERQIQEEILDKVLNYYFEKANEINNPPNKEFIFQINNYKLYRELAEFLPTFKDESFKEEKEWRIVAHQLEGNNDIKFRIRRNMILPYIEIELENSSLSINDLIEEIVVGPSQNSDTVFKGVEFVIDSAGLNAIVMNSRIPFRRN